MQNINTSPYFKGQFLILVGMKYLKNQFELTNRQTIKKVEQQTIFSLPFLCRVLHDPDKSLDGYTIKPSF